MFLQCLIGGFYPLQGAVNNLPMRGVTIRQNRKHMFQINVGLLVSCSK
jgi:hypothetical protein